MLQKDDANNPYFTLPVNVNKTVKDYEAIIDTAIGLEKTQPKNYAQMMVDAVLKTVDEIIKKNPSKGRQPEIRNFYPGPDHEELMPMPEFRKEPIKGALNVPHDVREWFKSLGKAGQ